MIEINGIELLMSNFTFPGLLAPGYCQLPTLSKQPSSFVKVSDLIFFMMLSLVLGYCLQLNKFVLTSYVLFAFIMFNLTN